MKTDVISRNDTNAMSRLETTLPAIPRPEQRHIRAVLRRLYHEKIHGLATGTVKKAALIGLGSLIGILPNSSEARQDYIFTSNILGGNASYSLETVHSNTGTEDYGTGDIIYHPGSDPPFMDQGPKITTLIEGYDLKKDSRSTNSVSTFNARLTTFFKNSGTINEENKVQVNTSSNSVFKGFNPSRHYTGEYVVHSNYNQAGTEFREVKNLRDLCPSYNAFFDWQGPSVTIPSSHSNEYGDVHFGEFNLECGWNQLISSKAGNGTNSFEGAEIIDYGSDRTVVLTAAPGHHIDHYVLTREGNIREVTAITNHVGANTAEVEILNIMGSNSLHVVYAPTFTAAGTPHTWYIERGVTEDFDTLDTTDFNNDGFTGHQKFLMNADDLVDDTDYFRTIGLEIEAGTPTVSIPHSKTNRRYRIERTPLLNPPDWTSPTNSLGTGATLILELPVESDSTINYRGAVELP